MIYDALLTPSNNQDLTGISTPTPSTNVIDLTLPSEIGTSAAQFPIWAMFTAPPTSVTPGATVNVSLQTSLDNTNWTTLLQTGPQPIANITAAAPMALRGSLPVSRSKYLRFLYTPSAPLTAGTVVASIGSPAPAHLLYSRNYLS